MLKERIKELIGREPDVEQTEDGQYIVLFMPFEKSPPPKGSTPDEAMEKFITYFQENHNEQQREN